MWRLKLLWALGVLVMMCFLAACTTNTKPATLTDGLGREVTLPGSVQRVVSLAPSNTELLFEVGAGSLVVGRDDFSDFPKEAKSLPSVGGSLGVYGLAAIAALKPDLVLAAQINTSKDVAALEKLGLTVFYLNNPTDMTGLFENLRSVGTLTAKSAETETLIASLTARLNAVIAKLPNIKTHYKVYYELDASDPAVLYTAGPGSYINKLLEEAGDTNIGAVVGVPFGVMSAQEIIGQNPDFIVLGDTGYGGTIAGVKARPGWDAINAVKNDKVFVFDNDTVSRPTARLVDAVESLAKMFHPEVFQ